MNLSEKKRRTLQKILAFTLIIVLSLGILVLPLKMLFGL